MTIITIGKVNRKILIPILGGIINIFFLYLLSKNPKLKVGLDNPFLISIYSTFGMILSFIPYLIVKNRTKQNKNSENSSLTTQKLKSPIKLEHYDIYKRKKWDKYKLILIAAIFYNIETLLYYIVAVKCVYNLWIFDIIFISLFSYIIFKSKLYRHQYISMIIITIFGFGLNIIEYFKSDKVIKIKQFW